MDGLLERNAKILDHIKAEFSFMVKNLQYDEVSETESDNNPDNPKYYLLKYTNQKRNRQLEILIHSTTNYKLITLKRLINNQIPNYYDLVNTVKVEDLDLFHSPDNFKNQEHIIYSEESKAKYFSEMANKFQSEWMGFIEGESWFDRERIDELYQLKNFIGKSGFRKDETITQISDGVQSLIHRQYSILINSNEEDPYKYTSHGILLLHNAEKDIYLKFNVSYKDEILSFEKRNTKHQSFRLLEFSQLSPDHNTLNIKDLIENWVNSELNKGGI